MRLSCLCWSTPSVLQVHSPFIQEVIWEAAQIEPASVEVLTKGMAGHHQKTCGLAVIKLKSEADAAVCLAKLDGYSVMGRCEQDGRAGASRTGREGKGREGGRGTSWLGWASREGAGKPGNSHMEGEEGRGEPASQAPAVAQC